MWLAASTDIEQFLQGLIQLAAAYHHIRRGTFPGSVRLFDAALRRLEPFSAGYCGLKREPLIARCLEHRAWVAELLERARNDRNVLSERLDPERYPKIDLTEGWQSALPKSDF